MAGRTQVVPGEDGGDDLLLRVAWYYHKDDLTQDEIATRLSVSRSSVARMLEKARKVGLVSVQINSEHLAAFGLSSRLRGTTGLDEVIVVPDVPGGDTSAAAVNARLGLGGAQYLDTHLREGRRLGIGFGDTVSRVVSSTSFGMLGEVHLVTLTGGVDVYLHQIAFSRSPARDGETRPATGTATVIPTPVLTSSPELTAALRAEPAVAHGLELARSAELAVIGIGTARADATLMRMGYVRDSEFAELADGGAVGDVLGIFFDRDGTPVRTSIHERRIGIEPDDLRRIDTVVGVAGGAHKVPAIRGALRSGLLDVLITDETAAQALLDGEG